MSEFHDNFPEYELMAHHSEEEGVEKRKQLWKVFFIMLGITIFELIVGFYMRELGLINDEDRSSTFTLKALFIGLTLLKAFYIIYHFMHLGHELKGMKYAVLVPYAMFMAYFIFINVTEANYTNVNKTPMDQLIVDQKNRLNAEDLERYNNPEAHGHGHSEDAETEHVEEVHH